MLLQNLQATARTHNPCSTTELFSTRPLSFLNPGGCGQQLACHPCCLSKDYSDKDELSLCEERLSNSSTLLPVAAGLFSGVATVGPSGALAPPSASVAPPSANQFIT